MTDLAHIPPLPLGRSPSEPFAPPCEYAEWRSQEPIRRVSIWSGRLTPWLVTSYQHARAILSDPRLSSDHSREGFPRQLEDDAGIRPPGFFVAMDSPEHDVLRKLVIRDFTVKRIERLRPAVQQITDTTLDAMAGMERPLDLVTHFCAPLPLLVICELLGVPYADRAFFQDRISTLVSVTTTPEKQATAFRDLTGYLARAIQQIDDQDPSQDMLSGLAQRVRDGEVALLHAAGVSLLMLMAGYESSRNMIALSTVVLLENAEHVAALQADPATVPAVVEELLRYVSVLRVGARRLALEDVEIGGVTIRAGDGVVIPVAAANRDPSMYDAPDMFDPSRSARHLAFGSGVHQCLGAPLARLELQIALATLFARFPSLRTTLPLEELDFCNETAVYGLNELLVTW